MAMKMTIKSINIADIQNGFFSHIFTSPEIANTKSIKRLLAEDEYTLANIHTIVFDEAHTLIDWNSFRPSYDYISEIVNNITPTTYHLLTATCNQHLYDIILTNTGLISDDIVFHKVTLLPDR